MLKALVVVAAASGLLIGAPAPDPRLAELFRQVALTPEQEAAIEAGRPVAKLLSWGGSSEVFAFGAVYIHGSPASFLNAARDVNKLAGTPGYLAIRELPAEATAADLSGLTLEPDDIKALKSCREGDCDVQLPATSIRAFRDAVNWSQPDAAAQANTLARGMIAALLRAYRRGGNTALGEYRDKDHPALVSEQFETMVGRTAALPGLLPELRTYLLSFPAADLAGAETFYYWEKVDFGMKPTIRVNHAVIYRPPGRGREISVVAIKQLYASHYFHTALDVSMCVGSAQGDRPGFYLLTLKASEQAGLTGMKGSIVRKVAVDKIRSSLERGLATLKSSIEQTAPPR
jgi:hypothetical protein